MATAKKLPSGAWRVLVYAGKDAEGKRQYKSFTAMDKREAEFAAAEWATHYREVSRSESNYTLDEAISNYIQMKSNILSPSTIRAYDSARRNHFKGIIQRKLLTLTSNDIQREINAEAAKCSPKTVKNLYGILTAVMGQYRPDFSFKGISLPQKQKRQNRALSRKEIGQLLGAIDGDKIEVPILLALWLGLRRSEILALEWSDIDLDERTIRIDEALVPDMHNKLVPKGTKTTDSTRTLRLPVYICEKIKALPHDGERIFNISEGLLSKRFPRICVNVGIPRYTFHDLRRSMATVGLSLNIADKVMMARGGWNNTQTMKEIYQVVLNDDANSADDTIDAFFTSLLPDKKIMQHEMQHENKNT